MQMAERGLRHRLSERFRVDGVQLNCLEKETKSSRSSITLEEVFAAFAIVIVGILASTVVLVLELKQTNKQEQLPLSVGTFSGSVKGLY